MDKSRLNAAFKQLGIDAIVSESNQTRLWFANVETSDGWLIIEKDVATLFVDGRYFEYVTNNSRNVEVKLLSNTSLQDFFQDKKYQKIAIESDYLTLSNRSKIKKMTNLSAENIISIKGQQLRIIKTKDEIEKLQKAINISLEAFDKLKTYIKEGITEREIDHKLNYIMKRLGADKEGFDNIIAFGKNTAMPHHHPTKNILKNGDIVTIDFGAKYMGYTADITRTFIFNENEGKTDFKLKEILEIVQKAAEKGIQAVRPGIKAKEIDNICRDYIKQRGYLNFFVHSTGHGLGLDVHEFPQINSKDETVLEEGMVITIEPGIYITELGGARIENDILVTKDGYKILSNNEELIHND